MKKLMMTTVAALGFAALAQADVLNSTGFEEYKEYDFAVNTSDSGNPNTGTQYWTGTGDFSQTVLKTYAEAEIAAPTNVPDAFKDAASNTTFLSVDTGSDVMYRKAGSDAGSVDLTQRAVFFDANVKFTASETNVEVKDGDKLLVWLKGDETTTNLIVTAGLLDDRGVVTSNETFVTDADVEADTWYRLTVKAGVDDKNCTYFNVYIDGNLVSSDETTTFYSLVQSGSARYTIAEAGFQGTGALDNVVWTTTDPFPPEGTYTLKFTGDEGFAGQMSTVTVGGDADFESFESFEKAGIGVSVKEVTVVAQSVMKGTVTPTTEAEGVTFSKVTMVETEETDPENPEESWTVYTYTFTVTVAEPAVGANYAIALAFAVGGDDVPAKAETVPGTPVQVTATDSEAAVKAVTVQGVNGTVYEASQKYYTKTAVETGTAGVFEVTVTLNETALDEDVDAAVEAALEAVKAGATSVALPAGFYYKVESGSALPIATTATGTTDGSKIEVKGLNAEAGFFKVSVGTTDFAE